MRDNILEYLKDKCCKLSVIHDDIKTYEETIRAHAKSIANGESIFWHKDIMARYTEHYTSALDKYNTIKREAQQTANVLGLKAEFEKMLQEYLEA